MTENILYPLELLHPAGEIRRCLVLGSNCPPQLFPSARSRGNGGCADLVLLAPSPSECRIKGWLEKAVSFLSDELSSHGLAYTVVPPFWRHKTEKLLSLHGLYVELSMLHLPNLAASHYLVPLQSTLTGYVVKRLLGTSPGRRRLASLGLRFTPTIRFIRRLSSSVGLVARRETTPPLFDWLWKLELEDVRLDARYHVMIKSPRPESCHAVLQCFYGTADYPAAIVKVEHLRAGSGSLSQEAKALQSLREAAQRSGAEVPVAKGYVRTDRYGVSAQTALRGTPAARFLDYKPRRFFGVLKSVTRWLETWNRATTICRLWDEEVSNRVILGPAERLKPLLDEGPRYQNWLGQLCQRLKGSPVPLVAAHNDLTMSNILILDSDRFGVIDWETSVHDQLPMMDFHYMAADAAAATRHYTDREGAFEACFLKGQYVESVAGSGRRLEKSIGLSRDLSVLCFHACWLHHAMNEHSNCQGSQQRPFLDILRKVVAHRETFYPFEEG